MERRGSGRGSKQGKATEAVSPTGHGPGPAAQTPPAMTEPLSNCELASLLVTAYAAEDALGGSGRELPSPPEISAILATPEVRERLAAQGAEAATATPEEFGRFLDREHARWSVAVKAANVKIE